MSSYTKKQYAYVDFSITDFDFSKEIINGKEYYYQSNQIMTTKSSIGLFDDELKINYLSYIYSQTFLVKRGAWESDHLRKWNFVLSNQK